MSNIPHYNAFISYRHHPQDIAVAEAIHKGLEHFKIPRSLRKQGKSIHRIFRDKEELPITSSLTDTITQALEHSDYQIVICSTHLKDSYWVQREIETFLKTHTKDQILTVIVDGEPQDVIPEILTYREITDPDTGETVREPLEPLSCDWRLPKREAMKKELPRLAAVLLGCTYNDLIQRQKQYRMRRLAIGTSIGMAASMALAAYFLYTSVQIQENLNQSLENQSQFLASSSISLYESGDRLTAIALALEALPTDAQPRPYVVAAEKALADALMLYDPVEDIIAVGAYTADAPVNTFALTDDGSTLYILDSRSGLTAWDTKSFEQISAFRAQKSYGTLMTDGENGLVVLDGENGKNLQAFTKDGQLRWERTAIDSAAFYEDKSCLLATAKSATHHQLLTIDPATGELLTEPMDICPLADAAYVSLNSSSYFARHPYLMTMYGDVDSVVLLNPADGHITKLTDTSQLIYHANTLPDGRVLLSVSDGSGTINGRVDNTNIVSAATAHIYCFSSNGNRLWVRDLMNYMFSDAQTLEAIPGSDNVFVQFGNNLSVLEGKSGKVLSQCHSSAYPLQLIVEQDSAWGLFSDGTMGSFDYNDAAIMTIRYMEAGLLHAIVNHGAYTSKSVSTAVTKYAATADESYETFDTPFGSYLQKVTFSGDYLVTSTRGALTMYNMAERKALWQDSSWETHWSMLGFAEDGSAFYTTNGYNKLKIYDIATGESTLRELPSDDKYPFCTIGEKLAYQDGHVYYSLNAHEENRIYLIDWDLATDSYQAYDFLPSSLSGASDLSDQRANVLDAYDGRVLLRMYTGQLLEYTIGDGLCRSLLEESLQAPVYLIRPDTGALLLGIGHEVRVLNEHRELMQTITLPEVSAVSLAYHNDVLYILCDDGHVYQYNEDGTCTDAIPLSLYSNFYTEVNYLHNLNVPISWAFTADNELILNAVEMGNLIPDGQSSTRATIPQFVCYHPGTDSLICIHNTSIIAYKRLSTQDLLTRGRETLGSFTLAQDQRTAYGLS